LLTQRFKSVAVAAIFLLFAACSAFGQATDGNITGTVLDPSGAAISNASVTAQNQDTAVKSSTKADSNGVYRIEHLLIGTYNITATAPGFSTTTVGKVAVELNKIATVNVKLEVGNVSTVVEIADTAAAIDTTTSQVSNIYTSQVTDNLASTANPAGGVLNLSLLGAGVSSNGGIGVGTGPSVGGQRARNNNFTIEGVDNNSKSVTGPIASVPNDAVQEFTMLQNQFSAEYGHSSGGQFNMILGSGTNTVHGAIWEYLENRNLNAVDQAFARQYVGETLPENPRYDRNRLGAKIGGPAIKNKLFYFGSYEYVPIGQSSVPSSPTYAPTAAGYSQLAGISTFSQTNLNILKQYLPAAPTQASGTKGTINVCNAASSLTACPATNIVSIPVGVLPINAPSYSNTYNYVIAVDYNLSDKDQLRGRYIDNKTSTIDTTAELPVFWTPLPATAHLGSFSEFHTFSPNVNNEFRLAYNRYNNSYSVTNASFPGLDMFPNLQFNDLNALQLGPNPNSPQSTIQNTYQLIDNVSWTKGRHEFKFGGDIRDLIAGTNFIQRLRGDYEYTSVSNYLHDLLPDYLASRNPGGIPYSGNQTAYYLFANDNWKVTRNLTVNLGVRYEFNGVAQGMRLFNEDAAASTPGIITFAAPKSQKDNFAPRIGFAYSPGNSATTSIRGGFSMAYDQIFDNVGTNATPPQASATVNATGPATGFLASGGIPLTALPANPTAAQLRSASSSYLPNQQEGYAINWNFGIQHVFKKDFTMEVRYLGTRGVHLLVQEQLNRQSLVTPTQSFPLYYSTPSSTVLNAITPAFTAAQLVSSSYNVANNPWYQYGYTSTITGYMPIGNSSYQGLAVEMTKRFASHYLFKGAYTWSHMIDDSTAEVNSTSLTPRRAQNFGNMTVERASSALDRRQRLTLSGIYETPWFQGSSNWFVKNILGNYQLSAVYTYESPELATPQSGDDANLNGDSAGDRVIINPNGGFSNSYSGVTALKNSAGQTVAYLANNPYALYIQALPGMYANSGRNILVTEPINNVDFNAVKNFSIRERAKFQLRADFFNGFNHAQYTPGSPNSTNLTQHVGMTSPLIPGNPLFDQWNQVFSSNPRNIQVGAKLIF
jgi:hypothetical protein